MCRCHQEPPRIHTVRVHCDVQPTLQKLESRPLIKIDPTFAPESGRASGPECRERTAAMIHVSIELVEASAAAASGVKGVPVCSFC